VAAAELRWPLMQTSLTCSTGVGTPPRMNQSVISAGSPQVGQFSSGSAEILISDELVIFAPEASWLAGPNGPKLVLVSCDGRPL
jgi:hypothetical protein